MRTIKQKLYSFNELSEEAKEKAVNYFIENWITSEDVGECVEYDAKQVGLSINSWDIDRREINISFDSHSYDTAILICKEHGEICETYKIAQLFLAEYDKLVCKYSDGKNTEAVTYENSDLFDEEIEELEKEFLKDISHEFLSMLIDRYEELCTIEYWAEECEANEREFYEDGSIY